jgi:glycosyltransferase involved in cell wall biosynthesis
MKPKSYFKKEKLGVSRDRIRVLFDEQIFLLQEHGGISRYFTELIKAFVSNPNLGIDPIISSMSVRNEYLLNEIAFLPLKPVKSKLGAIFHIGKQVLLKRKTKDSPDLVHLTFYLPGFFNRFGQIPKAVTIHDMIPEITKSSSAFWNPHYAKKRNSKKADLLFSVSDSTTMDLMEVYGSTFGAVTTYLGVSKDYQPDLPRLAWQPRRYILFVGNRNGYKDFAVALNAFAKVSSKHTDLFLLLVGGGDTNRSEERQIKNLGLSSRVIQKTVAAKELPNVYSNALALVYTSRYEGFGLPLVEAMASGIPILASNTKINKEIARESATYFPVGNSTALSELIENLYSESPSFQDKIKSGLVLSKNFSWELCAERTAFHYRGLIERQKV